MGANPLAVVGVDFSRTYTPASGLGTVTDTTNLPYDLGTVVSVASRDNSGQVRWKMVLMEDGDSTAGNLAVYTTDDNGYEISVTNGENTADNNQPAGLIVTAIADGKVGWIQTYGLSLFAMVTDNDVSTGENVVPHATTDGGLDSAGANDILANVAGHALDADTGTALAAGLVFLDCPKG